VTELTAPQARQLHLAAQGLLTPPARAATRTALLRCIERMQLLQIDTIHVVARSPYLVLFSRLGAYPPQWLDEALANAQLFETWAHEACFAPVQDVALHRSYNAQARQHWGIKHGQKTHAQQRAHLDKLLAYIETKAGGKKRRLVGLERRKALARGLVCQWRPDGGAARKLSPRVRPGCPRVPRNCANGNPQRGRRAQALHREIHTRFRHHAGTLGA
jgi:uncharacterized protein YcaQ